MGFFGPYVAAEVKIGRLASPSLSRKPHQVYCLCFDTIGSEFQHNCFLESVSGSTLAKASLIDAICRAVHFLSENLKLALCEQIPYNLSLYLSPIQFFSESR